MRCIELKYSIIVPCYNEEKNIKPLVDAFDQFADKYDMELLLVDNGSQDSTAHEIDKQVSNHRYVKKVTVMNNEGYGFGILSGLSSACGDFVGWIHADLQSDPKVFENMFLNADGEKGDFLYKGARKNRSFGDRFFTMGMGLFESVLFKTLLYDCNSQPTLLSRKFYMTWKNPPKDFSLDLFVYALALKKKVTLKRFDSPQRKRLNGESTWNTQWNSRIKMVRRVISYSFDVKKRIGSE